MIPLKKECSFRIFLDLFFEISYFVKISYVVTNIKKKNCTPEIDQIFIYRKKDLLRNYVAL